MPLRCNRFGRLFVSWTHRRYTSLMVKILPTSNGYRRYNTDTVAVPNFINKPDWNRAIAVADKLAGHPDLFPSLQSFVNENELQITEEIQKLFSTKNPLLKNAKKHIYDGRISIPIRGLTVLLSAKAASQTPCSSDVLTNQRKLAEITELIHTARLIHRGVINFSALKLELSVSELKEIDFANKILILVGDYMLANICIRLSQLANTEVFGMMCSTIKHFAEGEFQFEKDPMGIAYPSASTTLLNWETRSYLCSASLLAMGCRCATALAAQDEFTQIHAFEFGKWFSLTWQAFTDVQTFTDEVNHPPGTVFDLTSLPIILHLRKDPSILNAIHPYVANLENAVYDEISTIVNSGMAIQEAKIIGQQYSRAAMRALLNFPVSDERQALENILTAMDEI